MGKKWILVTTESFTKWVEAVAVKEANAEAVVRFIKENIICKFGLPSVLVSDNGTHFVNQRVWVFLNKIEVPTAKMLLDEARDREAELQKLEEKREVVGSKIEEYHRRLALAYDKHVRPRVFLEGDLVLKSVDTVMKNMLCQNELPNGRVLILFLKYTPTDIASY
ncbi:uncharacterized protein [Arachis hypogaea]|uniref:uncharacterized protein n=1 Tax=Arachis hypogaea TaxID=3818 RepID=UPI0007AF3066